MGNKLDLDDIRAMIKEFKKVIYNYALDDLMKYSYLKAVVSCRILEKHKMETQGCIA